MLASILKWFTEQFTGDVTVDLSGVSSNHGVGNITVEGASEPIRAGRVRRRPFWRPRRRPRPRPDTIVVIAPSAVTVDFPLKGVSSNHGVGQITVETPFDLTDDELLVLTLLAAA